MSFFLVVHVLYEIIQVVAYALLAYTFLRRVAAPWFDVLRQLRGRPNSSGVVVPALHRSWYGLTSRSDSLVR